MVKKTYKLDSFEQEIEDALDQYVIIDNEKEMIDMITKAAKAHQVSTQSIILNVPTSDFETIKTKAHKQGLSYPSYINMLIHNDVAGSTS